MYSTLPYSGSHIENWHSILRNGLVNASYTKLQVRLCSFSLSLHLLPAPLILGKSALKYSTVFASASSNLASCEAFLGRKLKLYI